MFSYRNNLKISNEMALENTKIESLHVRDFGLNQIDLMQKYAGKPLLIIIYNNKCLGCTGRAIPLAYEFQQEFQELQVIGIHTNFGEDQVTEKEIRSIFTIDVLPFPIYLDEGQTVYHQFESEGTPQWVLITKDRLLSKSIFGSQESAQNRLMYSLEQLL